MLKALTITAMLATPVAAETLSGNPRLEVCVLMSEAAELAMSYRQQPGATVAEGLRRLYARGEADDVLALAEALMIAAFSQPAWQSYRNKQAAIADFANEVFALCMRDRGELM